MTTSLHRHDADRYAHWILSEIDNYERYHNHKEMMAWVATALYLPAIVSLGYIGSEIGGCSASAVITAVVVLAAPIFSLFINMQFRKRWFAADYVVGLKRVEYLIIRNLLRFRAHDQRIRKRKKCKGYEDWPHFIQRVIDRCRTNRNWKCALRNFVLLHWHRLDDRWKTELPSYFMICAATVVTIVIVWS